MIETNTSRHLAGRADPAIRQDTSPTVVKVLRDPFFYVDGQERKMAEPGQVITFPRNVADRLKGEMRVDFV